MKSQLVIAFLLGAVVALAGVLVSGGGPILSRADASPESGTAGALTGVTGLVTGGNREVLWVIDGENQRLACYDLNNSRLTLVCARNIRYDLKLDEFPPRGHNPPVREVFEQTEGAGAGGGGGGTGRGG